MRKGEWGVAQLSPSCPGDRTDNGSIAASEGVGVEGCAPLKSKPTRS